ncbi:MAG: NlpC/P60 family protein [Proteocatella sp.]
MIKLQPSNRKHSVLSRPYLFILASLVCLIGVLFYYQPGVGYEIVSNGEHIGYVKTKAEAQLTVNSLNKQIRDEKGEAATYDLNVNFQKGKMADNGFTSNDVMKLNFEQSLDVKMPAYIIKSDNQVIMAVKDEETAQKVLKAVKEPYVIKSDSSKISSIRVNFIQDVEILKLNTVSEDKILESHKALASVNPSTGVSRSNLTRSLVPKTNVALNLIDVKTSYQEIGTVPVAPGVKKVADPTLSQGKTKVKSEGKAGIREVNRMVVMVNGQITQEKVLTQKVIQKATDKIVLYGTKTAGGGVLSIARQYLGVPYRWGGTTPSGFDCSGFTSYVYRQLGVSLPRTSYSQSRSGTSISRSNLQPGDLVYGPGHVGIYVGNGSYIHAPSPGQSVKISPLSQFRNFTHGVRVI